ncbi:MAG: hypothetical protein JNM72_15530 [Deltaproteobacteria bacterium]|nr:hypothetical protein [Deltaproteobacteria bacterium]
MSAAGPAGPPPAGAAAPATSALRALLLPLVLGLLVASPTLSAPWMLDDWLHQDALNVLGGAPGPAINGALRDGWGLPTLFCFIPGEPAARAAMEAEGLLPWFSDPGVSLCFWRPLSTGLAMAERGLLDALGLDLAARAVAMHAHTLLWYGLLVLLVAQLMRRLGLGRLGLVIAALFAIDDLHVVPVLWSASRNALWSACCALGAALLLLPGLPAADAAQPDPAAAPPSPAAAVGAGLLLLLGLFFGEGGAAGLLLILALALSLRRGWAPRLWTVAPAAAAGALWAPLWLGSGAAVAHTGWYRDPLHEPLAWLRGAAEALPILASNGFGLISGDAVMVRPDRAGALALTGALQLVVVAVFTRRAWPQLSALERRATTFGALAYLLCLLPSLSTLPQNRLLMTAGFGANVLVAVIARWCRGQLALPAPQPALVRLRGLLLLPIVAVHVGWAALAWPLFTMGVRWTERVARAAQAEGLPGAAGGDQLLVGVSDPALVMYMRGAARVMGDAPAGRWHLLSASQGAHAVQRTGPATLELRPLGGPIGVRPVDQAFRRGGLAVGHQARRGPLTITALEVDPATGGVTALRVEADQPFEELGAGLVGWGGLGYTTGPLPAVGEAAEWAWVPGPAGQ